MIKRVIKLLLPKIIINYSHNLRDKYLTQHYQKSYSQEGEDMILSRIFAGKKDGFYVDVGAHHPKRFSNTYFFYKQGWKGINIDAMPNSMRLFNKLRPQDINLEVPISAKKETLTYYMFNEPALNGFVKELSKQRNQLTDYKLIAKKTIQTYKLEEILDNHLLNNQEIDFISIDVEGLDFEVLESNDFNKYKPRVILIEILESNLENIIKHKITKYLKKYNYLVYAKAVNTVVFIRNDFS